MCKAVSVWHHNGEEVSRPCGQQTKGLCHYHLKMLRGQIEPLASEDTRARLLRVVLEGTPIWKA